MLAPILRLLAIYLAVGLAVFGFFKRDALMSMFGGGDRATVSQEAEPEPTPEPAPLAEAEPVFAPEPDAESGVPAAPAPTPATSSASALAAPAAPQAQPAPQSAETAADATYETGLNAARAAYWQGDTRTAIAKYKSLLAEYPEDESLNGELGNIYMMNGQRREAVTHFEKAGMAAIAAGNTQTAQMLVGVLRSLDPNAARRLTDAGAGN